jgi:hypothetical protein
VKILSNQDFNSVSRIQNLPDAASNQEPSTYSQLITKVGALSEKRFCRTSSGGVNINLSSAPANINGVVLNNLDRVGIFNQTTASENGIYVFNGAGNAMTRALDANTAEMLSGFCVYISEGGNNGSKFRHPYIITTVGTDAINIIPEPIGYHQQSIDTLTWSGALDGQVIQWSDALNSWIPATVSGGSGSPGGSNTQVQYNNSGSFAGAANVAVDSGDLLLNYSGSVPAATSSDKLKIFARKISGRMLPAYVGPSGIDSAVQPLMARNKIAYWNPPGNATTVPGVFGMQAPTAVGTATTRNVATTNVLTRMKRLGYVTAATAGTLASHYNTVTQYTTGTGSGLGGFHFVCRFAVSDAAAVSGARHFCGISSATAAPTNVEPSTLTNSIGVAQLSTDNTQWYLVYGGSAAQTAIALGTSIGSPTLNNTAWDLSLFSPPNQNAVVYYELTNIGTGVSVSGTLSGTPGTTTPASTTLLTYRQFRTNNATALAVGIDICSVYWETDQ